MDKFHFQVHHHVKLCFLWLFAAEMTLFPNVAQIIKIAPWLWASWGLFILSHVPALSGVMQKMRLRSALLATWLQCIPRNRHILVWLRLGTLVACFTPFSLPLFPVCFHTICSPLKAKKCPNTYLLKKENEVNGLKRQRDVSKLCARCRWDYIEAAH